MATGTLTAPQSEPRPLDRLWSLCLVALYVSLALAPLVMVGR